MNKSQSLNLIKNAFGMSQHVIPIGDIFKRAREERQAIDHTQLCITGIKSIDDRIMGIKNTDLLIVGAGTGAGKTQIAISCAYANAMKGKKVLFFMLEGDTNELYERFMQTKIMRDMPMSPIQFTRNIDPTGRIKEIEDREYDKIPKEILDNVVVFDKKSIPDVDLIVNIINAIESNIDLIIIDHAQYINFPDSLSESVAMSKIMSAIKNVTDTIRKPVIMFSHVTKPVSKSKDNISKSLLSNSDLHGSSNISKQASLIVLVEPLMDAEEQYVTTNRGEVITRISLSKGRIGTGTNRISTYMLFDQKTYEYTEEVPYDYKDNQSNF